MEKSPSAQIILRHRDIRLIAFASAITAITIFAVIAFLASLNCECAPTPEASAAAGDSQILTPDAN